MCPGYQRLHCLPAVGGCSRGCGPAVSPLNGPLPWGYLRAVQLGPLPSAGTEVPDPARGLGRRPIGTWLHPGRVPWSGKPGGEPERGDRWRTHGVSVGTAISSWSPWALAAFGTAHVGPLGLGRAPTHMEPLGEIPQVLNARVPGGTSRGPMGLVRRVEKKMSTNNFTQLLFTC